MNKDFVEKLRENDKIVVMRENEIFEATVLFVSKFSYFSEIVVYCKKKNSPDALSVHPKDIAFILSATKATFHRTIPETSA